MTCSSCDAVFHQRPSFWPGRPGEVLATSWWCGKQVEPRSYTETLNKKHCKLASLAIGNGSFINTGKLSLAMLLECVSGPNPRREYEYALTRLGEAPRPST